MAASGRLYSVGFSGIALAAAQDLIAVYAGASKIVAIQSVTLGQITGVTVANFRLRLVYLPATVTAGSGGGAGTVKPWVSGDAAATATARINDTTQATSGGTAVNLWDDVWNSINGFYWQPPVSARPPLIGLSGAFVVSLDGAPSSLVANGNVVFEELP
jgi:hypothetical protein